MIINKSGIIIRMAVSELRIMGRATQGVRLIRLQEGDEIASVARVRENGDDEIEETGEQGEDSPETNRSEEHTSELQSLMRISYAVFCLKKKKTKTQNKTQTIKLYIKKIHQ